MVGIIIIIAAGTHIHYYGIIIYRCERLLLHTDSNNIMHTIVGMRTVTYTARMLPYVKKKKNRIYYRVIIHLYIRWWRVVYEVIFANSEYDGDL